MLIVGPITYNCICLLFLCVQRMADEYETVGSQIFTKIENKITAVGLARVLSKKHKVDKREPVELIHPCPSSIITLDSLFNDSGSTYETNWLIGVLRETLTVTLLIELAYNFKVDFRRLIKEAVDVTPEKNINDVMAAALDIFTEEFRAALEEANALQRIDRMTTKLDCMIKYCLALGFCPMVYADDDEEEEEEQALKKKPQPSINAYLNVFEKGLEKMAPMKRETFINQALITRKKGKVTGTLYNGTPLVDYRFFDVGDGSVGPSTMQKILVFKIISDCAEVNVAQFHMERVKQTRLIVSSVLTKEVENIIQKAHTEEDTTLKMAALEKMLTEKQRSIDQMAKDHKRELDKKQAEFQERYLATGDDNLDLNGAKESQVYKKINKILELTRKGEDKINEVMERDRHALSKMREAPRANAELESYRYNNKGDTRYDPLGDVIGGGSSGVVNSKIKKSQAETEEKILLRNALKKANEITLSRDAAIDELQAKNRGLLRDRQNTMLELEMNKGTIHALDAKLEELKKQLKRTGRELQEKTKEVEAVKRLMVTTKKTLSAVEEIGRARNEHHRMMMSDEARRAFQKNDSKIIDEMGEFTRWLSGSLNALLKNDDIRDNEEKMSSAYANTPAHFTKLCSELLLRITPIFPHVRSEKQLYMANSWLHKEWMYDMRVDDRLNPDISRTEKKTEFRPEVDIIDVNPLNEEREKKIKDALELKKLYPIDNEFVSRYLGVQFPSKGDFKADVHDTLNKMWTDYNSNVFCVNKHGTEITKNGVIKVSGFTKATLDRFIFPFLKLYGGLQWPRASLHVKFLLAYSEHEDLYEDVIREVFGKRIKKECNKKLTNLQQQQQRREEQKWKAETSLT